MFILSPSSVYLRTRHKNCWSVPPFSVYVLQTRQGAVPSFAAIPCSGSCQSCIRDQLSPPGVGISPIPAGMLWLYALSFPGLVVPPLSRAFRSSTTFFLSRQPIQIHQIAITTMVNGMVTAQYTQKRLVSTSCPESALQLNRGMARNEDAHVAGRKLVVKTAMVFIEALSR